MASVSVDGVKDYHYKEVTPPTNWSNLSLNSKSHLAGKIFGQEQLDGNCQMYLALQDVAMPGFLTSLDRVGPNRFESNRSELFYYLGAAG